MTETTAEILWLLTGVRETKPAMVKLNRLHGSHRFSFTAEGYGLKFHVKARPVESVEIIKQDDGTFDIYSDLRNGENKFTFEFIKPESLREKFEESLK